MPKKIDVEKEQAFVDYFTEGSTQGNATKSAEKAGWNKTPAQMGAYLKRKLSAEIRQKNEERILATSSPAISVLQDLLHSDQDAVKLKAAQAILDLSNYSSQNINLVVDNVNSKTDKELLDELNTLLDNNPILKKQKDITNKKVSIINTKSKNKELLN
jgi:phage terminase small subunit